jgi:hypothetical protein
MQVHGHQFRKLLSDCFATFLLLQYSLLKSAKVLAPECGIISLTIRVTLETGFFPIVV